MTCCCFTLLLTKGSTINHLWGGMVRISANDFFFLATLRTFFFSWTPSERFFFCKIGLRIFFGYNMVLLGNRKKNFLGLNWPIIIFFSEAPWTNFFFFLDTLYSFFLCLLPNECFFSICTMPPQMIDGRPLIYDSGCPLSILPWTLSALCRKLRWTDAINKDFVVPVLNKAPLIIHNCSSQTFIRKNEKSCWLELESNLGASD